MSLLERTATAPASARPRALRLLAAVPLALAVLLLFHPPVEGDPFVIADTLSAWFAVHIGMLILTPALGIVAWTVVGGLTHPAAQIARLAILPFVAFHAAYDTLAGIGTGLLVQATAELPPEDTAGATRLVTAWWSGLNPHWIWAVSAICWAVFALCAAAAHWRSGSHTLVLVGLGLAAPYVYLHAGAPAAISLSALSAATWAVLSRSQRSTVDASNPVVAHSEPAQARARPDPSSQ